MIEVYTDGACDQHGVTKGCGGWAAILVHKGKSGYIVKTEELSGPLENATNQIAEMTAVLEAFRHIGKRAVRVFVYTDSQYLRMGITDWMPRLWLRNGWRTATGEPVKNQALWQAIHNAMALYEIKWQWVKGHAGHKYNERADQLAVDQKFLVIAGRREQERRT